MPNLVASVDVRGRAILVRNRMSKISVIIEEGLEIAGVEWLLEQLAADIPKLPTQALAVRALKRARVIPAEALDESVRVSAPASSSEALLAKDAEKDDAESAFRPVELRVRDEVLISLRQRESIEQVWFSGARRGFVVRGKFGGEGIIEKTFTIRKYARRREFLMKNESTFLAGIREMYKEVALRILEALGEPFGDSKQMKEGKSRASRSSSEAACGAELADASGEDL